MNLQELKQKNPAELINEAEKLGIENPSINEIKSIKIGDIIFFSASNNIMVRLSETSAAAAAAAARSAGAMLLVPRTVGEARILRMRGAGRVSGPVIDWRD